MWSSNSTTTVSMTLSQNPEATITASAESINIVSEPSSVALATVSVFAVTICIVLRRMSTFA